MNFRHLEGLGVVLLEDLGFDGRDLPVGRSNEVNLVLEVGVVALVEEVVHAPVIP